MTDKERLVSACPKNAFSPPSEWIGVGTYCIFYYSWTGWANHLVLSLQWRHGALIHCAGIRSETRCLFLVVIISFFILLNFIVTDRIKMSSSERSRQYLNLGWLDLKKIPLSLFSCTFYKLISERLFKKSRTKSWKLRSERLCAKTSSEHSHLTGLDGFILE